MKSFATMLALVLGLPVVSNGAANAQSMKTECYERSILLTSLTSEYGERLDQTRPVGNSGFLEAFKSPTDGTWTIIYSNEQGMSCVLATGEGLETDAEPRPELAI